MEEYADIVPTFN